MLPIDWPIVELEEPDFYNDCVLPETSMYQPFLVMKSNLANAIFSIFKMGTVIVKMAVKLPLVIK